MTINSLDIVFYTAIFLLPGFFMRNIIATLNPAKKSSDNIVVLESIMYSIINLAIWSWAYALAIHIRSSYDWLYWVVMIFITLIGAAITAYIIGVILQKEVLKKINKKLKLKTLSSIETAWESLFLHQEECNVVITLSTGEVIYGYYGENSFTSANIDNRDIYIELLYSQDENGNLYSNNENKGLYISKDLIKYIEFKKAMEET